MNDDRDFISWLAEDVTRPRWWVLTLCALAGWGLGDIITAVFT